MTTIVETYGWENARSGKCTVREIFVWEVSSRGSIRRGTILRENVSLGFVHEEVSVGELSVYQFINETFSEELL